MLTLVGVLFLEGIAKTIVLLAAYLIVGGEILWNALKGLLRGNIVDENVLMSVATIGAIALGDYGEGVMVMLLYRIGELLQGIAVGRSQSSIKEVLDLRPDTVRLEENGEFVVKHADEAKAGDRYEILPGDRIPLDGTVVEGESFVDLSAITGESVPVHVAAGDELVSGGINKSGRIVAVALREAGESTASRIIRAVEEAAESKPRMENFITRFARVYTPAVMVLTLLVAVIPPLAGLGEWKEWIHRGLLLLVISCPCALVLSIPLGFFAGIGRAARQGILLKGSNYLDALRKVKTVVFDKTGTLTEGVFSVDEVLPRDGVSPEELLYWAAHAELSASHPLGRSIVKAYEGTLFPDRVAELVEVTGGGVSARVEGRPVLVGKKSFLQEAGVRTEEGEDRGVTVYAALDGILLGCLRLSDRVKPGAERAVRKLRELGVSNLVMLTGDSSSAGTEVGLKLGMDGVFCGLMPAGKLEHVRRLKPETGLLAFVGDGMNDAPSLAAADIGIAMGGVGSDTALQAADVVVMKGDPLAVPLGMMLSQATERIIVQNIVLILGVKILVMVLGILGLAGMWAAVMADVGVCLLAVGNSMRIFRVKLDM